MTHREVKQAAKKGMREVANKHSLHIETIRQEIETAIELASKSNDPRTQAFWNTVPKQGETATPEEVIAYIAIKAATNKN
jgi:hypothetical protein